MSKFVIFAAVIVAMTGCASLNQGDGPFTDPVSMWNAGKQKSEKGEKIVNEAQEDLNKGREQVRDGEALILKGTELVERSREEYQIAARSVGASSGPDQVAYESDVFNRIAKRWEGGIDDIKKGNSMLEKGNKIIQESQQDIFKGRTLIDEGSKLMIDSRLMIETQPVF